MDYRKTPEYVLGALQNLLPEWKNSQILTLSYSDLDSRGSKIPNVIKETKNLKAGDRYCRIFYDNRYFLIFITDFGYMIYNGKDITSVRYDFSGVLEFIVDELKKVNLSKLFKKEVNNLLSDEKMKKLLEVISCDDRFKDYLKYFSPASNNRVFYDHAKRYHNATIWHDGETYKLSKYLEVFTQNEYDKAETAEGIVDSLYRFITE